MATAIPRLPCLLPALINTLLPSSTTAGVCSRCRMGLMMHPTLLLPQLDSVHPTVTSLPTILAGCTVPEWTL
jgi:hypothetical protein